MGDNESKGTLVGREAEHDDPEVAETRSTDRNGYRPKPWATGVGEIELAVPRKRSGESDFPSFLEPRKRIEKALLGASNGGSRRRRIDPELGIHMRKDQVSRIRRELDGEVGAFRTRPLEDGSPAWRRARGSLKVRDRGQLQRADGGFAVHHSGRREVIGIEMADSEAEAGWVRSSASYGSAVSKGSAWRSPTTISD